MFDLDFSLYAALYCLGGLAVVFGWWIYYDWRDKRLYDSQRAHILFHCIKCNHLYSGPRGKELCKCPKCHYENIRLKF